MLPQFTRAGNAARSLHTSTYLLGVIVLLLVTILLSSWRGSTDGYTQAITQSLGNTPSAGGSASTSHLYPRVVITGDSIAVKSFDYGESFGSKLAKMVCRQSHRWWNACSRCGGATVCWKDGCFEQRIHRVVSGCFCPLVELMINEM